MNIIYVEPHQALKNIKKVKINKAKRHPVIHVVRSKSAWLKDFESLSTGPSACVYECVIKNYSLFRSFHLFSFRTTPHISTTVLKENAFNTYLRIQQYMVQDTNVSTMSWSLNAAEYTDMTSVRTKNVDELLARFVKHHGYLRRISEGCNPKK